MHVAERSTDACALNQGRRYGPATTTPVTGGGASSVDEGPHVKIEVRKWVIYFG